jgi:hypothetical protein
MTSTEDLRKETRTLTQELNNYVLDATQKLAANELGKQFDHQFTSNQKIMNQEEYIRIAGVVQQKLDQQLIFYFAIFWLVLASSVLVILFYLRILEGKKVFMALMVIWIGGMSYLGYLLYKRYQVESIQTTVESASGTLKDLIRAAYPSIQKKCPERCQIKYDKYTGEKPAGELSTLFPSRYPRDMDYWKKGIPAPDSTPGTIPRATVMPNPDAALYTCELNGKTVQSAQPCDVYPGTTPVLDGEAKKVNEILQRGFYAKMGQE